MSVRYSRILAIVFMVFGGINLFLGGWLTLLGEFSPALIIGLVLVVITVGYWTRPYFIVEPNQIVIPAMFGPIKRNIPYDTLRMEEGRLVVERGGIPQRVPIRRWLSHALDWSQLEQRFPG